MTICNCVSTVHFVSSDVLNTTLLEPVKKCKDQNDTVITSESDQIWLQAESNKLTLFDKRVLENESELNDHHINYAQFLLKMQFPSIHGPQLTLLQEKKLSAKLPAGSVQIIHNSRCHHWLVATTMRCLRSEVKIYDSLFTYPDAEMRAIIKNLFQTARNPSFVMVKLQKQKGSYDCGLYTQLL